MDESLAGAPVRWTSLIGDAFSLLIRRRRRLLDDRLFWARHTAEIQRDALRRLLERGAETEFGRAHGFGRIARLGAGEMVAAYRREVPVADWYAFREPLARMREGGEANVLWPGVTRFFAQTSGTTAGEKYLPVSREMLRSNRRAAFDIFANAERFGVSLRRIFGGRILYLGGSTSLEENAAGTRTGDLSAIALSMLHRPVSSVVRPTGDVALMEDWPAKLEAMARQCVREDVRMITGVPSWMLTLFNRVTELAREGDASVRALRDAWPHLTFLVHGGVRYDPFDPRIRRAWSGAEAQDVPHRLEVYPASEAFIAMQDEAGDPGLRLLTDIGNYFEFVPEAETVDPAAPALGAHEVEAGERYLVCVSSCAGLWRYVIGDVVVFDTVPRASGASLAPGEGPARLRIVGRHRHFMNAFGEHVIVEHVETGVARAARETGLIVGEFTAAPFFHERGGGGIELVVEFEGERPPDEALRAFARAIDETIKSMNLDYTAKRTADVGMDPPRVTPVATGVFHRWMESRGKLGGQHKCPRCANDREYADAILRMAQQRDGTDGSPRERNPARATGIEGKDSP